MAHTNLGFPIVVRTLVLKRVPRLRLQILRRVRRLAFPKTYLGLLAAIKVAAKTST